MKHARFALKAMLITPGLVWAAGAVLAQEVGQVLSSTPVVQQLGVPRQVCTTEQVLVQAPKSGAGALLGAIAGGAIGSAVGSGGSRAATTMLGVIGGSVVGDRVEGQSEAHLENVQRCEVRTQYENHVVGYNVVYEYAGKRYTTQLAQDPGPSVQLQVTPVGAAVQVSEPIAAPVQTQPVYLAPAYPAYYTQPYYPPISIGFGIGYWGTGRYRH